MMALLLNHLWQSLLCAGLAGLLALALRRNGANVRFWVWFAASIKFLMPFAVLSVLGAYILAPIAPPVIPPMVKLIEPLAKPFSASVAVLTVPAMGPQANPFLRQHNPWPRHHRQSYLRRQSVPPPTWTLGPHFWRFGLPVS
jgi:hypothetical protein